MRVLSRIAILLIGLSLTSPSIAASIQLNSPDDDKHVPYCTKERYLYGEVEAVHGSTVLLKSTGSAGNVYVLTSRAKISPSGVTIKPGAFARAYGCFGENREDQNTFQIGRAHV